VYAFIATPVQFWHHHKYAGSISASHSKEEKIVSKSEGKAVEANCQICSHHYSIYADDASTVFVIALTKEVAGESFPLQSIPAAPFFNSTGRGPPTV
jgi:hypothetical protein